MICVASVLDPSYTTGFTVTSGFASANAAAISSNAVPRDAAA